MVVNEIMTKEVATCGSHDDLASVAKMMEQHDCGFVPVVDSHGMVTGVLTDRDVCLTVADLRRPASRVEVKDAMSAPVFSCLPDENLKTVLGTMATHHVRRLPVIDKQGHLKGVLSIDDIIAAPRRRGAPTAEEVVDALKHIAEPQPLARLGV